MDIEYKQLKFEFELKFGGLKVNPKRNKSDRPRSKADFYQTPFELAYATVNKLVETHIISLNTTIDILDPGCGNGVWTDAYIKYIKNTNLNPTFYGIDIDDTFSLYGKFLYSDFFIGDFLNTEYAVEFDLIFGNPPFSLMEEFVRKSYYLLRKGGVIAFLGRLEFLGSQKRCKGLFEEIPPYEVWVSSRRPSFFSVLEGKHTTDMMEYAIFIWRKEKLMYQNTALKWLMWEYDK